MYTEVWRGLARPGSTCRGQPRQTTFSKQNVKVNAMLTLTAPVLQPTPILSPAQSILSIGAGARKKAIAGLSPTLSAPSASCTRSRSSMAVIRNCSTRCSIPACLEKVIAGHMVLGRARDSVPEPRRAVVAARDQGSVVEELHLRDGTAAHARKHISMNTSA